MTNSIKQFMEFGVKKIEKIVESFMSTCGEIKYFQTYFKSKETEGYKYLAD